MFDKYNNYESHCNKSEKRMHTSRAALNRLLDEKDASLTLTKLASAASALVNEPVARRCATVVSHDTLTNPSSVSHPAHSASKKVHCA